MSSCSRQIPILHSACSKKTARICLVCNVMIEEYDKFEEVMFNVEGREIKIKELVLRCLLKSRALLILKASKKLVQLSRFFYLRNYRAVHDTRCFEILRCLHTEIFTVNMKPLFSCLATFLQASVEHRSSSR